MNTINFHNKTFHLLENSSEGRVNTDTIFKYQQDGDLVTADYFGGPIRYGKIIAILKGSQLDMRYQCLTTGKELKTGKAIANISFTGTGKLKLALKWQWLEQEEGEGTSEYLED